MFVRISIGNLAHRLIIKETGESRFFGILNSAASRRGTFLIGALGGAAKLTSGGKKYITQQFQAQTIEGMDARFVVPAYQTESVLKFFTGRVAELFEIDPTREISEELSEEKITGISPVLSREEVRWIQVEYVKTMPQPFSEGLGTSARERFDIPTRRLFHFFEMVVPEAVFLSMSVHPAIRLLTEEELATTKGGSQKGTTNDGVALADNLFW
jgi:hypothetical protein